MEWLNAFLIGLTALISSIGTLIVTTLKTKAKIEESIPRKVKKQSGMDVEIIDRMEDLKELLGADRVQIYDFSNGGHWANGRSALKTSCTYEVVRVGSKSCQHELQMIPISCIPKFIHKLIDNQTLEVTDLEDIKDTMPSTYSLKTSQGVKSFYDVVLENKEGEPIGFLGIQYVTKKHRAYNDNERVEVLRLKFFIEEILEKMIR